MLKLRVWSWVASISLVSVFWFFYWAFIYEIVVWNKNFEEALSANPFNILMVFISLAVFFLSFLLKKTKFATVNIGRNLPSSESRWLSKKRDLKGKNISFQSEDMVLSRRAPRKIRVPGLRFVKRKVGWLLLILDVLIVIFTLPNTDFLVITLIFFLNAFYILDYLYKTRKPTILEERKAEKENR